MNSRNWQNNRREFVKLVGSGMAAVYLTGCVSALKKADKKGANSYDSEYLRERGPFHRDFPGIQSEPSDFSGDQPSRPHHVLWDKKSFIASQTHLVKGQLPPPEEKVEVVVVGGGMSGLISTYFLRDKNIVLLEQASRLGGNAKGESWNGIDYSIGAAYTDIPEPDSPIAQLWKELGIDHKYRIWKGADPLYIGEKLYPDCWKEGTLPGTQKQFVRLGQLFEDVLNSRNGYTYPEIPAISAEDRKKVNELDQISIRAFLEKQIGEPLLPEVEEYIEHYFWTASAGSASEISAAAGLNFFAGDFDKIAVFPGGNAAIAEALVEKLAEKLMRGEGSAQGNLDQRLRTSSLVFDVKTDSEGVLVSYLDPNEQIRTIRARTAILACPKFVVAKLMDELEPERLAAIHSLKYRAYLVANALVDQDVRELFYDAFFMKSNPGNLGKSIQERAHHQKVTDAVLGSYAQRNPDSHSYWTESKKGSSVLTLSRSMPYDGGRAEIYQKSAYEQYRKEFEDQLVHEILPQLGIREKSLKGLRLTRWGHPLPLSAVGNIASGKVDWLRKPFEGKVFFAEQDNWTLPCFETAFHEALTWTTEVRKLL